MNFKHISMVAEACSTSDTPREAGERGGGGGGKERERCF